MKLPRGVPRKERRGSALLLAIFFLMLLFLIALALFQVIPSEMHSAGRSRQDLQAHYACSTGVKHAVAWLAAVVSTDGNSIGTGPAIQNEPFRMDASPNASDIAYRNPGGNSAAQSYSNNGLLSRFNGTTGADFDGVSFGAKPYLQIVNDLEVGNWAVRVWIFPDRQTYPIPERFPGLLVNPGQPGGDSTTSLALRYYTIVAEAYPFGDPDTTKPRMRSKVTIGQQNFAKYARFVDTWPGDTPYTAALNQKSVDGPFHTNSYFRIRPANASYFNNGTPWNGTSSFQKMTYAGSPEQGNPDVDWNNFTDKDGVAYKGGNFQGSSNSMLPWDVGGTPKLNAYEKLAGGRANVQNVSNISLPQTTSDLQLAAWGFDDPNPVVGAEGNYPPDPDGVVRTRGVFVRADDPTNRGVYIMGDSREAVLGVADNTGVVNFNDTAVTQTGNPAMLVQQTATIVAPLDPPIYNTFTTSTVVPVSVGEVPAVSTVLTTSSEAGTITQTNVATNATAWSQSVSSSTQIHYSYSSQVSTSVQVTVVAGGGGFGEEVTQTITHTLGTQWFSTSTGQTVVNTTHNVPTGWATVTNYNPVVQYDYTYNTQYTQSTVYSNQTTYSPSVQTIAQSRFYPTDRVIEVNTVPATLPVTMSGKVLAQNGVPLTAPLNVGVGNIVLIKDSRVNGQQAEVTVLPGTLNGVVYSEDNINNLHGVNKGKRTIATSLETEVDTNTGDITVTGPGKNISIGIPVSQNLAQGAGIGRRAAGSFKYPNNVPSNANRRTQNSTNGTGSDDDRADILQWGTTPGQDATQGGNALGLVSQRVGLNIHRDDMNNIYRNNQNAANAAGRPPLRIYAVILAGRGLAADDDSSTTLMKGGFRIFNLLNTTDGQDLRFGKQTVAGSQYAYFKLFGGLIERKGASNWLVPNPNSTNAQGWDVQMAYDEWTSKVPPPFFPVTSEFVSQLYIEEFPDSTYQAVQQ